MKIYRVAKHQYIDDLSGEGARLYGGRWNKRGFNMLYFSESLSLCVLEMLVHLDVKYIDEDFNYMEVEVPDEFISNMKASNLSPNWRVNPPQLYTQDLGVKWLKKNKSLGIKVPSAVLPVQNNILVNPNHKLIDLLKVIKTERLNLDSRLYK